jgi:hypothetical protein
MTYSALKDAVGTRARRGESLDAIGTELIEPSGLSDAHKSALWLYGWVCGQEGILRYQRRQHQTFRIGGEAATPSSAGLRSDAR